MSASILLAIAWLASTAPEPLAIDPPVTAEEQPFPLESTILKGDGETYYVAGRARLPHGATVTSLRGMTLVGRGEKAVLEVSGKLEIKATKGGHIYIKNLTIEVMPDCKDLLITQATFSGTGGVRSSDEGPASCEIFLKNLTLNDKCGIDLRMTGGQIDLQESYVRNPVRIEGIDRTEKNRAKLKLILLSNSGKAGFAGGLFLTNAQDALVRNCRLGGPLSKIERCQKLDFDGNNVSSTQFEVLHDDVKDFKKTTIKNCDFHTKDTRLFAPGNPKKPDRLERMTVQGCWFHGATDPEVIRQKYVKYSGREPGNGMLIVFKKPTPRPRGLGG